MSKVKGSLRAYSLLLRLYPREHRNRYGTQMQQTVADMLEDAPSYQKKAAVWTRIIADLPVSVCKEHAQSIGEDMMITRNYGAAIGTILGLLAVLVGAGFPLYNKIVTTYMASDTLRLPTPLYGFLFPAIALLIASVTFFALKASSSQNKLPVKYLWLVAVIAIVASINIGALLIDIARH